MAARKTFNCLKCPGYCCSYPLIALNKRDVERLAAHFDLTFEQAKTKFTCERYGHKYSMRRKKDEHFGGICRFFDTEERRCTIYSARPATCRSYPGNRCGYWDFLPSSAPLRRTKSSFPPPGTSKRLALATSSW